MKRMELANRQRFVDKHYPPAARAIYKAKANASMAFWQIMGKLRGQPVQVR
jgi:L-alanine-DL-glutamate epimerase-like enolase superfamily enzyme